MSFIILFSYIHIEYFDHIHPTSHSFTASTSQTIHLLCSCHFVKGLDIRYERKNMWYFSPLVWFIYLSMMIFSSIYFPKKWHNFILLYDWIIITNRHTHTYTHSHSLVDGQLSWFYCLAIINCAAINMDAEVALLHSELLSLRYMSSCDMAESFGSSIFSFLRNFHTNSYFQLYFSTYLILITNS
jgi:hypothetical protein